MKNYDNLEDLNNDREFEEKLKVKYDSDRDEDYNNNLSNSGNITKISPSKHGHLNAKKRIKDTFKQYETEVEKNMKEFEYIEKEVEKEREDQDRRVNGMTAVAKQRIKEHKQREWQKKLENDKLIEM